MFRHDLFDHESSKASLIEEQRAYDIWTSHYPQYAIVETDKTRAAIVDALITFESGLYAVVEVKSRRNLTRQKLANEYGNQLLLMKHKVINCQQLAKTLCTRLIVFYYLRDEDTLIVQGLQDNNGQLTTTLNYGSINVGATNIDDTTIRQEAVFVDLNNAKYLTLKKGDTPNSSPS